MGNSIFTIHPYNPNPKMGTGIWVFDDKARDIKAEPFVNGIPEMIDHFTKDIPKAAKGFTLLFSKDPIPGAQAHLIRDEIVGQGTWYHLAGSPKVKGWLCPVLYAYFDKPPKHIYCQFQALKK